MLSNKEIAEIVETFVIKLNNKMIFSKKNHYRIEITDVSDPEAFDPLSPMLFKNNNLSESKEFFLKRFDLVDNKENIYYSLFVGIDNLWIVSSYQYDEKLNAIYKIEASSFPSNNWESILFIFINKVKILYEKNPKIAK